MLYLTALENTCCVPPGSKSGPPFVALPIILLDSHTLPLSNYFELNITNTPFLPHISLFHIRDSVNSSGTCFVGTLDSADGNNFFKT